MAAVLLLIGAASPAIASRSVDVDTSTSVSLGPSTSELLAELAAGDFERLEHGDGAPIRLALTVPKSWPYSDLQVETRLKGQKLDRYLEMLDERPLSITASRSYGLYTRPPASGVVVGPNQYQFALNSPYNYNDPTGEIVIAPLLVFGAKAAAAGLTAYFVGDQAIDRFDQITTLDPHANFASSGARAFGLAVSDTVGTTGIYEGLGGTEVLTGRQLSAEERGYRGGLGALQAGLSLAGGRALLGRGGTTGGATTLSWPQFMSANAGRGLSNQARFFTFSRARNLAQSSVPGAYQAFVGAARANRAIRETASRTSSRLRRYMHIEDHHLIAKNLWRKNDILKHAESRGIKSLSRDATWNRRMVWGHRGGHINKYYSDVSDMVDAAFSGQSLSRMTSAEIERRLADVAGQAMKQIRWGRVPRIAQPLNKPYLRMYR